MTDVEYPLRPLVELWRSKLDLAAKVKWKQFGEAAEELTRLWEGKYHEFLYDRQKISSAGTSASPLWNVMGGPGGNGNNIPRPMFRATINKPAELVGLFGPSLYYQNPHRKVAPKESLDIDPALFGMVLGANPATKSISPEAAYKEFQAEIERNYRIQDGRAALLGKYLNFTPNELHLKMHSMMAVNEALVKGRGLMVTKYYKPSGRTVPLVGSFFQSVDDLQVDPDTLSQDAWMWTALRGEMPYWKLENEYGIPRGALKKYAKHDTTDLRAKKLAEARNGGMSNASECDRVTYYEIYSKVGFGDMLAGAREVEGIRKMLEPFGEFVRLVIVKDCPYFLNLSPWAMLNPETDFAKAVEWPIPAHMDDGWPFKILDFHPHPDRAWPTAHLTPTIGHLVFLNWFMSVYMGKAFNAAQEIVAIADDAESEMEAELQSGKPRVVLRFKRSQGNVGELVQFVPQPPMGADALAAAQYTSAGFDEASGLSEILYGRTSHQFRSAEEAAVKNQHARLRPDYMADQVENWQSEVARLEATAVRLLRGEMLPPGTTRPFRMVWDTIIAPGGALAGTSEEIAMELDYTVEAGSTRKPNVARDLEVTSDFAQWLLPMLQTEATAGNPRPLNQWIKDYCKARGVPWEPYQISAMSAPPPPPPGMDGPPPEEEAGGQPA